VQHKEVKALRKAVGSTKAHRLAMLLSSAIQRQADF
jgi:hypothetical protein